MAETPPQPIQPGPDPRRRDPKPPKPGPDPARSQPTERLRTYSGPAGRVLCATCDDALGPVGRVASRSRSCYAPWP